MEFKQHRSIPRYGWKPSLPDQRDIIADTSDLAILDQVDPRKKMTAVYNQGSLGSCTANAVAAALDYWRLVNKKEANYPSRLQIYWLERYLAGLPLNEDTGAYGRDGFKAARRFGTLPEKIVPYNIREFTVDPRPVIRKQRTLVTKLDSPYKVVGRSVNAWKRVFSNDQTIAFGFTVYSSFESDRVADTGIVPHPAISESILGGHEVLAIGYLKNYPEHVLCRNSWGTDWGMKGYFLMPWSMILDPNISDDFRTVYHPKVAA